MEVIGDVNLKSGDGGPSRQAGSKARGLLANHFVPSGESVEVDVVAHQVFSGL